MTVLKYIHYKLGRKSIPDATAMTVSRAGGTIEIHHELKTCWISLFGDFADCEAVRCFMEQAEHVFRRPPESFRLDLTNIKRANSMLIAGLVLIRRRAAIHDVELFISASTTVETWLIHCRTEQLFRNCLVDVKLEKSSGNRLQGNRGMAPFSETRNENQTSNNSLRLSGLIPA